MKDENIININNYRAPHTRMSIKNDNEQHFN